MLGVEDFSDFSIDVRMKIKTIPGDGQFMVKRRALALIKVVFEKAGIQMPFPTVRSRVKARVTVLPAAAARVAVNPAK